jgi:hypothetical protein
MRNLQKVTPQPLLQVNAPPGGKLEMRNGCADSCLSRCWRKSAILGLQASLASVTPSMQRCGTERARREFAVPGSSGA